MSPRGMFFVVAALMGMCTYPANGQQARVDGTMTGSLTDLHVSLKLNSTLNLYRVSTITLKLSGARSLTGITSALKTPDLPAGVADFLEAPGSFIAHHQLDLGLDPHQMLTTMYENPQSVDPSMQSLYIASAQRSEFVGYGALGSVSHGSVYYDRETETWIVDVERSVTDSSFITEPCMCKQAWTSTVDVGCNVTQYGCPAQVCDGDARPWCIIPNGQVGKCLGERMDEGGGWQYCSPTTTPIEGDTFLNFTITNFPMPDHCDSTQIHIDLESATGAAHFAPVPFPTATGCQAAPVFTKNFDYAETSEDTPINMYGSSDVLQVNDSTPSAVPMVFMAFARNGSVMMNMTTPYPGSQMFHRGFKIAGTEEQINAVMASMMYVPDKDFFGDDTITFIADDRDFRGPGPNGVTALNLRVLVNPVPEPVMVHLGHTTPVRDSVSASVMVLGDTGPIHIDLVDPDDMQGVEHIQATVGVSVGHLRMAMGDAVVDATMPADVYRSQHTINGTVAEVNKALGTLVFQSDGTLTCAGVVEGELNVMTLKTMGGLNSSASFPLYVSSEGLVDGCGRDTQAWADFMPKSALVGQQVTVTFLGFKAYSLPSGGISAALSRSDKCYLRNFTHVPVSMTTGTRALALTLPVTEVGNFTLCYWTRGLAGVSEWGEPNPIPMVSKMEVYSNTSTPASTLFGGFTTCQSFVDNENLINSTKGACGCMYTYDQVNTTSLGVVSLPMGYPAHQLTQADTSLVAKMGCCTRNTPVVHTHSLGAASSWGLCADMM